MGFEFLVGPIVGAVIGGITNSLAIKMLFRPINPVKIGNYTLPFTPGVIPKEKARIAHKIGQVVSTELLNEEVLASWLLKEEVYKQIEQGIDHYLKEYVQDKKTLQDLLIETVGKERSTYYICEVEEQITEKLYNKVVSMELGKLVIEKIHIAYQEGKFGNILGPMSFFINDNLVESIAAKIEPIISKFIEDEGESIIRQKVEEESEQLLSTNLDTLAEKLKNYEELIKKNVLKVYEKMVTKHMNQILNAIDIARIVEERILSLDSLEIEKIIISIMRKELNAIVWFGVLLGAIMGCVTSII
ncbi:MAG: DUF445 family protein [Cellulosilyticum sp.]|nr:DUF445 family protein [Cellulosilyticum sp.]